MEPSPIEIRCDCGKTFRVARVHLGKRAVCPVCKKTHPIVEPAGEVLTLPEEIPDTKRCPYCAEPVKAQAVKCRHCGENLGPQPAARRVIPAQTAQDDGGSGVLVMGILSLVLGMSCGLGFFLGPVAWIMGSNYLRECRARGVTPNQNGTAGRICGIISTVILLIGLAFLALVLFAAAASGDLK